VYRGGDEVLLSTHLDQLEQANLVHLAQPLPELEYLFRHALIWDTAYFSILQTERRTLHLAIAEKVEQLYLEQRDELAAVLAYHFQRAGQKERARHYFTVAGERALAAFANREAEAHYRAALELTEEAAEQAALLVQLGNSLNWQDRFEEALQAWGQAIPLYADLGNVEIVARLFARSARSAGGGAALGEPARALALCREGLAAIAGRPETPAVAALLHETVRAYYYNGLLDEACDLCQQALAMAERLNDTETQAETLVTLWGLLPHRSSEEAVQGLLQATELAESAELLATAARARHNLGVFLARQPGQLQAGLAQINQAIELARRVGSVLPQFFSLSFAAYLFLEIGDIRAAEKAIVSLRELLTDMPNRQAQAARVRSLENLLLRHQGRLDEFVLRIRLDIELLRREGDFADVAHINIMLADALLELNELTSAAEVAADSLNLAERGLINEVEPLCLLSAIAARQGNLAEAGRYLAQAQAVTGHTPGHTQEISLALASARLAAAECRWPEALAAFAGVTEMARTVGLCWYQAHYQREWAEVYLAHDEPGDTAEAIALLETALLACQEMNLPLYERQILARLATLR
jgi:tetratricopeptide (TPR) repeat protein